MILLMLEVSWIMIVMMTAKRLIMTSMSRKTLTILMKWTSILPTVMLRRRAAVYSFSSVDDDDNKSVPTTTTTTTS